MGAILLFMFVLGFINTFKECIVANSFYRFGKCDRCHVGAIIKSTAAYTYHRNNLVL